MPRSPYLKHSDDAFADQLVAFKNAIGAYATLLGLSSAQVTAQAADADYFVYVLAVQLLMLNGSRQWTMWKDLLRQGGTPPATGVPVAPVFPTAVVAVALGIEARFRALVKLIKANANYNLAIGEALGIEGAEQTGPDYSTIKPNIGATVTGGAVVVAWGWEGYARFLDQCEIQVDRGDGQGFKMLSIDTTPGYTDTQPFPATPAKWTYQAIFRVGDVRVGQWSKTASVMVG